MPVYNGGPHLEKAIASIVAQTYCDWEMLLIDDGSTDESVAMLIKGLDSRIRVFRDGKQRGLAARLNECIDMAETPYIARMDHDDIAHPERFSRQVRYLDAHPKVDLLACRCLTISESGRISGALPFRGNHAEICRRPWLGFYMPHPSWMGRARWFRAYRYAEPAPLLCEDQELLLRSYATSEFECLPDVLVAYRLRDRPALDKLIATRSALYQVQSEYFGRLNRLPERLLSMLALGARVGADCGRAALRALPRRLPRRPPVVPGVSSGVIESWQTILDRSPDLEAVPSPAVRR